jgi:hypothetical protein
LLNSQGGTSDPCFQVRKEKRSSYSKLPPFDVTACLLKNEPATSNTLRHELTTDYL